MILTEQEAKERWCPFVRYTSIRGQGINRWVDDADRQVNPEPARCIASQCMAWRWGQPSTETKWFAKPPETDEWRFASGENNGANYTRARPNRRGFCGLAWRPE